MAKKSAAKKALKVPSKKSPEAGKAAKASSSAKAAAGTKVARVRWLDSSSGAVLIEEHARKLTSFIQTMADGHVDDGEIEAQEARLVALMKEVEPLLDDATHAKVTRLLCELTAYDIMQMLNSLQKSRPATRFRG